VSALGPAWKTETRCYGREDGWVNMVLEALTVCWNCERQVATTTEVMLRPMSGGRTCLQLCGACYSGVYQRLVYAGKGVTEQTGQAVPTLIVEHAAPVQQHG
jgi:hypothetical protein